MRKTAIMIGFVLGLCFTSCFPSNVVAVNDRAVELDVVVDQKNMKWRPATIADFGGYWRSVRITGEPAQSLRKIYYWFSKDGKYSGAALVDVDGMPSFQVLTGELTGDDKGIELDGQSISARMAERYLEISTEAGCVLLQRVDIE